jgi:hypothetical protein
VAEIDIQKQIQLALSPSTTTFRNNTGMCWAGEIVERAKNFLMIRNPRPLHAGLCVGSSDLIGWHTVIVQPEMVGKPIAVFAAIEVKRPKGGRISDDQLNFLHQINRAGGIGTIARSPAEALEGILSWFRRITGKS